MARAELKITTDLVKQFLTEIPETRDSDNILYYHVLKEIGRRNGIDIESMSVPHFFLHLRKYGFPQLESIRRARQKVQARFPELAGTAEGERRRLEREDAFLEYARKEIV